MRIPWHVVKVLEYYRYEYGWDEMKTAKNVLRPEISMHNFGTNFDPLSVMMYPILEDLLDPCDPDFEKWRQMVQKELPCTLSNGDKSFFKEFYSKRT